MEYKEFISEYKHEKDNFYLEQGLYHGLCQFIIRVPEAFFRYLPFDEEREKKEWRIKFHDDARPFSNVVEVLFDFDDLELMFSGDDKAKMFLDYVDYEPNHYALIFEMRDHPTLKKFFPEGAFICFTAGKATVDDEEIVITEWE